jgi:hypothetical protein
VVIYLKKKTARTAKIKYTRDKRAKALITEGKEKVIV